VQGWKHFDKGERIKVDVPLEQADAADYDALLLPGGVANPDQLRALPKAVQFVRAFFETGKPVAAICHGPWTLIDAGVVRGRTLTSWPSLKTDLVNAGALWVDQEVCVDHGLVSSRKPADIPAFNHTMIEEFAGGRRARGAAARTSPGTSPRTH
jgi:protease I